MHPSRYKSLVQLAGAMAGFAFAILLLESQALLVWAERLEVGPVRTEALKAATYAHKKLQPLGADSIRRESLAALDRLGWSDDPARLAAARNSIAGASAFNLPCNATTAKQLRPTPSLSNPAAIRGASVPIANGIPARTPLAPLPAIQNERPRVVALVGDSMMAVGLGNVLLRASADNKNLRVIKAFRSGTGLARPDVFDWMDEYPAMIDTDKPGANKTGEGKPDAIIVAMGANDGQGFVEDGKVLPFGSDAWVKVYQQRTAAFLDLLTQDGARVVWVGLPPMKSSQYDARIAEINRIAYSVVSQNPQATWWNPDSLVGDESGNFREFVTTPDGKTTRLRQPDGIHLSDEGAALLAPALMNWLNAPPPVRTAQLDAPKPPHKAAHAKPATPAP